MTKEDLINDYVNWMYDLVCTDTYSPGLSYHKLFGYLYNTPFDYSMPMDGNRSEDGVDLRYRYGRMNNIPDCVTASYLDDRPCSLLEMMIALAIRCEEHIMEDPDIGDRVGQWFWDMVVSLDINMPDSRFDYAKADEIMDIFFTRTYAKNGKGGLFTISDPSKDMRKTDIWYQMCFYLNEMLGV